MDGDFFESNGLENLEKISLKQEKELLVKIKKKEEQIENIFAGFFNLYKKEGSFDFKIISCPKQRKKITSLLCERRDFITPIIESNIRLIIKLCNEDYKKNERIYIAKKVEVSDIFQNCVLMILRNAFYKYNADKKTKFMSYAKNWIMYSFHREKKVVPHVKALPLNFWERWVKINRLKRGNPGITDNEIIKQTKFSKKTMDIYNNIINVDNCKEKDYIFIEQKKLSDIEASVENNYVINEINSFIDALPDRTAAIIQYRFGLNGYPAMTLDGIGSVVNLTKERVRQICNIVLKNMRKKLPHLEKFIK